MATLPPGTPENDADQETKISSDAPAPPDALLGGKYRVERVIGEGAFGRVYLATDTRLRRAVAIKELLATRNATDPEIFQRYLDRFEREARAGGAITNPNVVTVYELEIDNNQNTYLVMEYVDGTNLAALLNQVGTLPIERVVAIALDIARGLEVVHEADVVHRDLKPANIMISRRGGAKLGDFGIAQVGTESQRTQVVIGHPGTPLYMSPEQASGFGYIDGRSDLYSLGLVIYEMLVGEPYARRRTPLAQARPETPAALVAIVEKLIQKDPDRRYQSATDLITDLGTLSAAQRTATTTDVYAVPPPPQGSYQPAPPQTSGYPGNVGGVPSAYGGASSQPPSAPAGYGGPPSGQPGPYAAPAQGQGIYGAPPQSPYGTQPLGYAPQPPIPPQKRGGLPPLAIVGIIAAVLVVVIGGIALATSRGGGGSATATAPVSTQVASAGTVPATTTAVSTPTASASTAATVTPAASPRPAGTPTGSASATAATTRVATVPLGGLSTARATTGGATPFPTASNQVKLTAGKPLPTNGGPNVFVDDENRYTVQYPTEWSLSPGDANTDVQFTFQGDQIAGVTTSDLNGDPKPTAQQLADEVFSTFGKQLTNFKVTDSSQVKVAGQDGVRMLYTFTDKANTVTLGGYLLTYSTDQTVILFSGYSTKDTFDARVATFDSVGGSFTPGATLDNTYADPQNRFSFDFPGAWAERKSNSSAVAVLVAPSAGTPSFNVVTESSGPLTLQQYYDANVKKIADPSAGLKAYKKVSESDTTIAGLPAKLQVYTADLGNNGTIYELHQWYIVSNNKGYVLTYSVLADKAKDFAGIGPIIANTFTLS